MKELTLRTGQDIDYIKDSVPTKEDFDFNDIEIKYIPEEDMYWFNNEDEDERIKVNDEQLFRYIWACLLIDDFLLGNDNFYTEDKTVRYEFERIMGSLEQHLYMRPSEAAIVEIIAFGKKYGLV